MDGFREALRQKDFVVTADLPLQPLTTTVDIERSVAVLGAEVDAVQVIDDRDAVGHMSPVAAAAIAIRNGVDAVVHLTGRDRNRVALQAELLGAAALGVTSLVIARGEKLSRQDGIRGKGVFDTHETRLMGMARRISEQAGLVSPPGFLVGTYASIFVPGPDWQAARIGDNIDAGVRFLLTQPCLNARALRRYAQKLVELRITHRAALVVDIPLLAGADAARDYRRRKPAALVPEDVIARLAAAADPVAMGIELCAGMLAEARSIPGISGANIRCNGAPDRVVAAVEASGIRRAGEA